jgi:hypothetical protein
MTRANGTRRPPDAETLRLTTFHSQNAITSTDGWWSGLVGSDPESTFSQGRLGLRVDVGSHADATLALQFQRGERIDWIMTILPASIDEPVASETSTFPQRSRSFVDLMNRWLQGFVPGVTRIAFGAVLMTVVNDEVQGHELLSNYLNWNIDEGVVSDFNYRANRRSPSDAFPEIAINRLTRWSVGQYALHALSITPQGASFRPTEEANRHWCRLELDINTQPQDVIIPGDRLPAIWREMVERGSQIVRNGDVP